MDSVKVDAELNASGLVCPLPLLKAKQALKGLDEGQVLRVLASDPGSVKDFKAFAELSGHRLLHCEDAGPDYIYILQKNSPGAV